MLLGVLHSLGFAGFHLLFWRLFRWRTQLAKLSPVNAGIMQVLNFCLTYGFVAAGGVLWNNAEAVLTTRLGTHVLWAMAGFWMLRLGLQFIFFPVAHWATWVLNAFFLGGGLIYGALAWTG